MEQKQKFFSLTMAQNDDTPKKQKTLLFNKIYSVCKVTVITFDPMIYHTSRME